MLAGRQVGNIRIGEPLGEGGMGAVYRGFDETLRRQVAVKAIKSDRLDADSRARFLNEARILSQLDHPNICRIHEFVEDAGEEFLVLELIAGRTLASSISDGRSPADKLRIAERIASALAAAHAKGIVHRDLKPGNVMLTPEGGVKVLDFGLARPAADPPGDEVTRQDAEAERSASFVAKGDALLAAGDAQPAYWRPTTIAPTAAGGIVGTPSNMSPEQARGEAATPASDMYALGLLLQELFTGRSAYPPGISNDLLMVKAADGDTLPIEDVDPDITPLIQQLKSIAPGARPNASATLESLQRIRDKPRRRLLRLTAVLAFVAVAAGVFQYVTAVQRERNQAIAARKAAVDAGARAEVARQEAEQVTDFLVRLIEQANPEVGLGEETTVADVFEQSTEQIDELDDQPSVQATLRFTIAEVFHALGRYPEALALYRQALASREDLFGPQSLEVAPILTRISNLLETLGENAESLEAVERAVEIFDRHPNLGPRDRENLLQALRARASIAGLFGDNEEAASIYRRLLAVPRSHLPPDHPDLFYLLGEIAIFHYRQRQFDKCATLAVEALAVAERAWGQDHPEVGSVLTTIALCYTQQGEYGTARAYGERSVSVVQRSLDPEHPYLAMALSALGRIEKHLGELEPASMRFEQAIEIFDATLGPGNRQTGANLGALAVIEQTLGRLERAEELVDQHNTIQRQTTGFTGNFNLATGLSIKADLRARQGDRKGAKALLAEALEIVEGQLESGHYDVSSYRTQLAATVYEHDAPERARELYLDIVAATERRLADRPRSRNDRVLLAKCRLGLGRLDERAGNSEDARSQWRRAREIVEDLRSESEEVELAWLHSEILLAQGDIVVARPIVEDILASGVRDPYYLEIFRRHGLGPVD